MLETGKGQKLADVGLGGACGLGMVSLASHSSSTGAAVKAPNWETLSASSLNTGEISDLW